MAGGSLQLYEYPMPIFCLVCEKCGRAGQYRKENLIERYGRERSSALAPLQFLFRNQGL
jgi:hypothetical protein